MDEELNIPAPAPENPKKYIRTFGGDMETVEKGGEPDLAPLPESRSTPLERIVAASPVAEEKTFVPPPPAAPPAQRYVPPSSEAAPIKTYGGDFVDHIKETNASTATMLAAEGDRSGARVRQEEPKSERRTALFIAGGVLLLIAGGAGAYFAYSAYTSSATPVIVAPSISAPIFVDDRQEIAGTRTVLAQAVVQSVARPLTSGNIRLLHMASSSVSVFAALFPAAPSILLRNINEAGSMAGVVSAAGVQSPFFILSVTSYSDTFAGMLSYETLMTRDMAALYPPYPASAATSSPLATTTALASAPLPGSFRDETASNHDVRVYRDSLGKSVLLYGYWNPTTLVIARDPAAFAEVIGRLATSRSR